MAKRPSFQFYPGDWLRDTALRTCSVSARGLWIEMICLMHEGSPYGHLKVGQKVILPSDLARMVGAKTRDVNRWLAELFRSNVCEKRDDGTVLSRRMVRDEEIRLKRAAGGAKGGNPALLGDRGGLSKVGRKDNLPSNLRPTPSSASASSSSSAPSEQEGTPNGVLSGLLFGEDGSKVNWQAIIIRWNDLAKVNDRPKIFSMNDKRRTHYRARFRASPDFWEILERELPLLGETARNAKSWCTFPWLIQSQENLDKLAEGNYRVESGPSPEQKIKDEYNRSLGPKVAGGS